MKVALTALAILLALATSAQAAQRYAAPESKGPEPCAQAAPCSLEGALKGAKEGDEVIVGAGFYNVTTAIAVPGKSLFVHGDFAGPMPRINGATPNSGPFYFTTFPEADAHVEYLEISNTTGKNAVALNCGSGMRLERARLLALSPADPIGLIVSDSCLVRDSVISAQGEKAIGIFNSAIGLGSTSVARNLTVVAHGAGSAGAVIYDSEPGTIDLRNTILRGDDLDLHVEYSKPLIGNSSFASFKVDPGAQLVDLGGNQTAPPLFVNSAAGDYREAAGSPTIDAGFVDQLAATGFAGEPRTVGAAPDIGAFEYQPSTSPPPPPPPLAAGELQSLTLSPSAFEAAKAGEAVASAKRKTKIPVGTTVTYSVSAAATTTFTVVRKSTGRRVGKKCAKQTRANKSKAKCAILKPLGGSFTQSGAAGSNSFKFTGRIAGRALSRGGYVLTAAAGGATKSAGFKIAR